MKDESRQKRAMNTAVAIVIALALAASLVITVILACGPEAESPVAVIHDSEGVSTTLPLDRNDSITIETELGYNTIAVEDGEVYVVDADCKTHDCMKQGKISRPPQQIICLPHRLWIEIVDPSSEEGEEDQGSAVSLDSISR